MGARHGDLHREAGDEAGRRLAAVQVTKLKAATQRQVAAALGTDLATVWRWVSAYSAQNGLAGLLPAKEGPKGPTKLTPELTAKINDLDAQGLGLEAIASQCGVSTFAVRTALGRVPARPRAAAPAREERQPGEDTAGQDGSTARQDAEDGAAARDEQQPAAGGGGAGQDDAAADAADEPAGQDSTAGRGEAAEAAGRCCRCCRTRCRGTGNAGVLGPVRAARRGRCPGIRRLCGPATRWPGC